MELISLYHGINSGNSGGSQVFFSWGFAVADLPRVPCAAPVSVTRGWGSFQLTTESRPPPRGGISGRATSICPWIGAQRQNR